MNIREAEMHRIMRATFHRPYTKNGREQAEVIVQVPKEDGTFVEVPGIAFLEGGKWVGINPDPQAAEIRRRAEFRVREAMDLVVAKMLELERAKQSRTNVRGNQAREERQLLCQKIRKLQGEVERAKTDVVTARAEQSAVCAKHSEMVEFA